LKQGKLIGHFISNSQSLYYQGTQFTHVLQLLQNQPHLGQLRENGNKLTLTFQNVRSVWQAIEVLEGLEE
jgi:hypothetical protein